MRNFIQLEQVAVLYRTKYQRVDLFNDFSMSIPKGELAVILGPSGSGKTTLLNLIAGFVKPVSGSVLINEQR